MKSFIYYSDTALKQQNIRCLRRDLNWHPLGPVVQSPISANPGLNSNLLFLFMYFCMIICFKTLENKISIEPEKISGKTYST
jgi:hypothetical protein